MPACHFEHGVYEHLRGDGDVECADCQTAKHQEDDHGEVVVAEYPDTVELRGVIAKWVAERKERGEPVQEEHLAEESRERDEDEV